MSRLLCLDVGTTHTGYAIVDVDTYKPLEFGKVENADILKLISTLSKDTLVVFERFMLYANAGYTMVESIVWYGKFVRECEIHSLQYEEIYRKDVKKHVLGKIDKSKGSADSQMRKALVERFAVFDKVRGKGTKKNPDFFYGFSSTDVYAAFSLAVVWIDKNKGK